MKYGSKNIFARSRLRTSPTWFARGVGGVATLCIHAFMLSFTHLGETAPKVLQPDASGLGATAGTDIGEPLTTVFIVNLPTAAASSTESSEAALSPIAPLEQSLISVLTADVTPAYEPGEVNQRDNTDGELSPQEENPAVRAQMFARYSGQIDARILRAWRRPRSGVRDQREVRPPGVDLESPTPDRFRCQVQITQDDVGRVKDIALASCNGTVAWQMSLVRAIQQASPLPAPPVRSVFSNSLTLNFESDPFGAGSREDGFETEAELVSRLARR